jgi:hypothetical protein
MTQAGMPEADLIPVAIRDPESLAKLGLLKIQKIHLMPSF